MNRVQIVHRSKVLALALMLTMGVPSLAAAQSTVTAAFDWSVPDRFTAAGMKGVKLPFAGVGVAQTNANMRVLNPERAFGSQAALGWPANMNACGSAGDIVKYIWTVNGQHVAESAKCKATLRFPLEGAYKVGLTVVSASGATASVSQDVNIQDWLIIGLGDSYGSGEGNPNIKVKQQNYVNLDIARTVLDDATAALEKAKADLLAAQAKLEAAQMELAAALLDYKEVVAAFEAYKKAAQELALAQAALIAAEAAYVAATVEVNAATAAVVFECAQFWDPQGCTDAKARLAAAKKAQAVAANNVVKATARLAEATAAFAAASLALPAEGFEYVIGVLQEQVDLLQVKVSTLQTAFQIVKEAAAFAQNAYQKALTAATKRAKEIVAKWQDSRPVGGQIIYPVPPFYRPDPYSQCHQSKFSGQALAALQIEKEDPKTSVTFIHLACTGSTVFAGLFQSPEAAGNPPSSVPAIKPQLLAASELSEGREVDAFVTSIGGNDVHFAKIIEQCATTEPCFASVQVQPVPDAEIAAACDPFNLKSILPAGFTPYGVCEAFLRDRYSVSVGSTTAADLFDKGLNGDPESTKPAEQMSLAQKYAAVDLKMRGLWPDFTPDRMFITPYPRVTRDEDGNICGLNPDPTRTLPGISPAEYLWAETVVTRQLNDTIALQAATLGWTVVDGIEQSFASHGYCSANSWMVRIGESFLQQMDHMGTAHPNEAGHRAYADKIHEALRDAFYPAATATSLGAARVDRRP